MRPLSITQIRDRTRFLWVSRLVLVDALVGASMITAMWETSRDLDVSEVLAPAFVSTSLLALEALRRALRTPQPEKSLFANTMIAAILNGPGCLVVAGLVSHRLGRLDAAMAITSIVASFVFGLVVGVPLGAVYSVAHSRALHALSAALSRPSHRSMLEVRRALIRYDAVGVIAIAATISLTRHTRPWMFPALALGMALIAFDVARLVLQRLAQRRWLDAVRTGTLPGLRLVAQSECRVPNDRAPFAPVDDSFVAVVQAAPGAPYRDVPEALMLVPSH